MHACLVLQKVLRPVIVRLDVRNARNLFLAVEALLLGRRLTLMELARHWPGAERLRAPLKRLDRFLGNRDVQAVRVCLYEAAMAWLLRSPHPTLIVDWSELKSDGRWHLLRAGIVAKGRTLTVYEEVHPEAKKNSPVVEAAFLKRLHALLPKTVRPILITDAGFRAPWFRAVAALGWHWVGRVRHRMQFTWRDASAHEGAWIACKTLYPQAVARARSLGVVRLTQSHPLGCRLVLVRRRKRGRIERTRYGQRARSGHSLKIAAREKEPWLLAASPSLNMLSAAEIVTLYARRMQIEQSFRDLKSHRYGCAFEDTLTRTPERLEMLLLIHALASLAAWLAGLAATASAVAQVCAPSLTTRYSALWIGWACLRHGRARSSGPPQYASARLRELLAQAG
jgi:hypothetical protein